jgi:hypothetical protein
LAEKSSYPHIFLPDIARTERYLKTGGETPPPPPERDRLSHADRLLDRLDQLRAEAAKRREELQVQALPAKKGYHLEIESEPGFDLALQSLDSSGLQLVNVRRPSPEQADEPHRAVVFVPRGRLRILERKIRTYRNEDDRRSGKPKNLNLVARITEIRLATLRSFWNDPPSLLPSAEEAIWWEVWLRSPDESVLDDFHRAGAAAGLGVQERSIAFPETRVLLTHGSLAQMAQSIDLVDAVAELRRAKEASSFFRDLSRREEAVLADDLRGRSVPPQATAPRICILDTGVNHGHPLLELVLSAEDLHTVEPAWGVADRNGHGTGMGGLATYGDLSEALATQEDVELVARLESAKILPSPSNPNRRELHGAITEQAVGRVEVNEPDREHRVHLMAVSTQEGRDRGRPSSWSAAVDKLAFAEPGEDKRLWILSAGNLHDPGAWATHPRHLATSEIHDPGQSWNALTVGGCTHKWRITEETLDGWQPLPQPGDLNHSTSTSCTWAPQWPLKPDVVFEAGSLAKSPHGDLDTPSSLSLLTTYHRPLERLFTDFGDTSAASAQVARMAAAIRSRYPTAWPETIRALIVHSARWSDAMLNRYGPTKKTDHTEIVRSCGHGIPDLDRALRSAKDRLTLIAQDHLQPFEPQRKADARMKEINFYSLPWPRNELMALGAVDVRLRVTLSYFIDPNPSERGHFRRHRYASHGLRYDICATDEPLDDFRKRLTEAAREDGEKSPGTGDPSGWTLGSRLRNKGSIHSDTWTGSAADLADRYHLAIYPVSGWWKEERSLGRSSHRVRYSLVVSIETPGVEVDLYTPILNQIGVAIET